MSYRVHIYALKPRVSESIFRPWNHEFTRVHIWALLPWGLYLSLETMSYRVHIWTLFILMLQWVKESIFRPLNHEFIRVHIWTLLPLVTNFKSMFGPWNHELQSIFGPYWEKTWFHYNKCTDQPTAQSRVVPMLFIVYSWACRIEPCLIPNPEDSFSRDDAHLTQIL